MTDSDERHQEVTDFTRDVLSILGTNTLYNYIGGGTSFDFQHAHFSVVGKGDFFIYETHSGEGNEKPEYLYLPSNYDKLIEVYRRELKYRREGDSERLDRVEERFLRRWCLKDLRRFFEERR